MKFTELKRSHKKLAIRVTACILGIAVLGGGITTYTVYADKEAGEQAAGPEHSSAADGTKDAEKETGVSLGSISEKGIDKEETVYLICDASGAVKKTIVSEHLYNRDGKSELVDTSTLKDIVNVKGDETFTQDGSRLVWKADGREICYQGTTDAKAPVEQKLTYYLDGKEIAPDQLAGRSGKVTIRFDYINHSDLNGVCVPFTVITGMVLNDHFSNVEITNGKLVEKGKNPVVIGYALPGMGKNMPELTFPEYFEITADVRDFSMSAVMTVVGNAANLADIGKTDLSELDGKMNRLAEGSSALVSGSGTLASGMDTLKGSLAEYAAGMEELYGRSKELITGIQTLNSSAAGINGGVAALDQALHTAMTKEQKAAAEKKAAETVDTAFANGQKETVAKEIYAALRYQADGSDGALYTSLYQGTFALQYQANLDTAYKEVVRQTLLSAAGLEPTDPTAADQLAAAIRNTWKAGSDAYMAAMTSAAAASVTGTANPAAAQGLGNEQYQTAFVAYQATEGMTSAQLAEFLYARTGAGDTLLAITEEKVNQTITQNASAISGGVEASLKKLADSLAGACKDVALKAAAQAAVAGAEGAKAEIAGQIEAVGENGYSLVTGADALSQGTQTLADQMPKLITGIEALYQATGQLTEGVTRLDDGAKELAEGMLQFDQEGISALSEKYNGDLKPFAEQLQKTLEAGESYQTFTALPADWNGSVKFIYKLEGM